MLFIKACRYYGLMKSDQHVEGNQKEGEATPGDKPDLHRNAKVIAGMAGLKNAGPPKSQGSYGPKSSGSNAPKSAGSNAPRSVNSNAPKSSGSQAPKPKAKMVDSGC